MLISSINNTYKKVCKASFSGLNFHLCTCILTDALFTSSRLNLSAVIKRLNVSVWSQVTYSVVWTHIRAESSRLCRRAARTAAAATVPRPPSSFLGPRKRVLRRVVVVVVVAAAESSRRVDAAVTHTYTEPVSTLRLAAFDIHMTRRDETTQRRKRK